LLRELLKKSLPMAEVLPEARLERN